MEALDNRAKLRLIIESQDTADIDAVYDNYIHANVELPPDMPGGAQGREGLKTAFSAYKTGIRFTQKVEDLIAEGDKVVARSLISGEQIGPFMGLPNTGKRFVIMEILIAQFRDGKVIRFWRVADRFALMEQLGKVPT